MRKRKAEKRQRNRRKPSQWLRNVLKQPEKNAQRDPGEKGWACYYWGKDGHLNQDCPQASKPPPVPCLVCKDHTGRETALIGVGFRSRTLKTSRTEDALGSPNKLPS